MRTRKRPRRSHIGKTTSKERNRIKRKRKAQHTARMEYWERRKNRTALNAQTLDPDKRESALKRLAELGRRAVRRVVKPKPRAHRSQS